MSIYRSLYPRLNYKINWNLFYKSIFYSENVNSSLMNSFFPNSKIYFFEKARYGLEFILNLYPELRRVGVQPLTCPSVLNAITKSGKQIVFVDISMDLVLDDVDLKYKAEQFDILIVTHTFGFPANINKTCDTFKDKIIIEDCAHSFLTKSNGKLTGTVANYSIFSFGFGKFPSSIQGGFILDNENKIKNILRHSNSSLNSTKLILKTILFHLLHLKVIYGIFTKKFKRNFTDKLIILDKNPTKTFDFPNNFALKYFLNQIKEIELYLEKQIKNGEKISVSLFQNKLFTTLQNSNEKNNFLFPVFLDEPDDFIQFTESKGIEVGKHFVNLFDTIANFGYETGDCPNYEIIVKKLITLPTHYNYSTKELNKLCELIRNYSNQ